MSLYLQKGDLIFKELEISNRNFFGVTDLSVKVVPFNNRIALDKFLWSVTEAAQRPRRKSSKRTLGKGGRVMNKRVKGIVWDIIFGTGVMCHHHSEHLLS